MTACFSLMLGFEAPLDIAFDAALIRNTDISWASVNSSKPDRDTPFSLLIHSTNAWAQEHIDEDRSKVLDHLCKTTSDILNIDVTQATHKDLHGWRYANISKQNHPPMIDKNLHIAACGDWCIQGRIEAAFSSALALHNALKHHL